MTVSGRFALHEPLLLESLQVPSLPSAKDSDTGTLASLTIVEHADSVKTEIINIIFFIILLIIFFKLSYLRQVVKEKIRKLKKQTSLKLH
jgi:hypothetical protein